MCSQSLRKVKEDLLKVRQVVSDRLKAVSGLKLDDGSPKLQLLRYASPVTLYTYSNIFTYIVRPQEQ